MHESPAWPNEKVSLYGLLGVVATICEIIPSFPESNSMPRFPCGTEKWSESMNRTALFDSTIQPGNEDVSSSRLVGRRTPREAFLYIHGPSSKSPLVTALSAGNVVEAKDAMISCLLLTRTLILQQKRERMKVNTFGRIRSEELLDGDVINDRATGGVILHAWVPEHHMRILLLR